MGCFARVGLEVVTTTVPSSHAQHADLAEDRADVAITATDNLFAWDAAGSDIVLIGQIETTTDLALLLRPGLDSLDELGAVRLAVDAPANGFAVVAYAMMARLGRAGSADGAGQHAAHRTRWSKWAVSPSGSKRSRPVPWTRPSSPRPWTRSVSSGG